MSFFTKSDGTKAEKKNTASVGGFQPLIPDGTKLQCNIAGAVWGEKMDKKVIIITLHVTEQGKYRNFKVDHTLKVFDDKDSTRDNAIDMLMAYDTLCRGALSKMDKDEQSFLDNNAALARALNGGSLIAEFDVWEIERDNGEVMTGNWVRGIFPKPGAKAEEKALDQKAETHGFEEREPGSDDDYDDDIQF